MAISLTNDKFINSFWVVFLIVLHICPPNEILGMEHNRENSVVRAVRIASPVVVNISSEYEIRKRSSPFSGFGVNPFFDSFFNDFFEPGFEKQYKKTSLGSGVIIDGQRGFIITNAHVLTKTGNITVTLKDKREYNAQIVGADPDSDLAVLRIDSKAPLPAIEMGNSDDLMIGETVIAIGNPFGLSNTVTTGVISALNRSVRTDDMVFHDFIQTDASINPGNSGGPLLNINSELIGINTAIYAKAQGIGFAIPINKAQRIVSDLIRYGEVVQAWIGITVQNLDATLVSYLKIPEKKGVLVKTVEKAGPAEKAGIRNGDIILSLGTRQVVSTEEYLTIIKNYAAGDTLKISLLRKGKNLAVSVKTAVFPIELAKDLAYKLLGIKVDSLPVTKRFTHNALKKEGVVISEINQQSYLAQIGAEPGDIIRQIDDVTIKNIKDFEKTIVKYRTKNSIVILLQRKDQLYYITVKL
jgi:Do/DeqQ family serine protease